MAESFPSFFFQQGFHLTFGVLAAAALLCSAVAALAAFLSARIDSRFAGAVVTGVGVALLVTAVGITVFEALALWYRPDGDGVTLRADDYRDWAHRGFFLLYTTFVLLAIGGGWVLGHRRTRRGARAGLTVGAVIAIYLVVTFPFVEFLNACNVGAPIVLDRIAC